MKRSDLLENIDDPKVLERLYRENMTLFKEEFNLLYPELKNNKLAAYWYERLNYESSEISWGSRKELIFVIIASLVAGLIAKLPAILNILPDTFYPRNIGFIVFPVLTIYFIWRKKLPVRNMVFAFLAFAMAAIFINSLPEIKKSDTLTLSCIHLPLFLWSVLGFTYAGEGIRNHAVRLDFLRYYGDLVIMTGLILIAGGILTGVTIGLFSVIGLNIEEFYVEYIVTIGLAAAPVIGTYITQVNPQLINKVSPVIAKIFSPLVLITLLIYLPAMLFSGKDPYQDREFLLLFNGLLIGVMAIILFSVAETFKKNENKVSSFILLALSTVTIIVNAIALSAILFRISEWGITPNRLAVLGSNILMLIHLLIVTFRLFRNVSGKAEIKEVQNSISVFLPVYVVWTITVTFIFPLIFHFA